MNKEKWGNFWPNFSRFGVSYEEGDSVTKVASFLALVEGNLIFEGVKNLILEQNNIFLTKEKFCIGAIDDIIGSIKKPSYVIKCDAYLKKAIAAGDIKEGAPIFVLSKNLQIMYQEKIEEMKSEKGSDYCDTNRNTLKSNTDMFYSDDEEEMQQKQANRVMKMVNSGSKNFKRKKQKF